MKCIYTYHKISLEDVKKWVAFAEKNNMEKTSIACEFIASKPKRTYGARTYKAMPAVIEYTHYEAIIKKLS